MMRGFIGLLGLLAVLSGVQAKDGSELPVDRYLIHIFGPWQYPPKEAELPSRTAPASILRFSANGEYVEHHAYVIDNRQGKRPLTISAGDGHTVAVGSWSREGSKIIVVRKHIYRFIRAVGNDVDPLCKPATEVFDIGSNGLLDPRKMLFRPTNQLDVDDWNSYVAEAKTSDISCQ